MTRPRKLVVIGLDAAVPDLLFREYLDDLPNLRRLVRHASWGRLRSCDPPITVPAWSVMTSGVTPGRLGVYGFRNRWRGSYEDGFLATGAHVVAKRVWDHFTDAGLRVSVHGVPQSFPAYPVNGVMTACFLSPNASHPGFAFPPDAGTELRRRQPDFSVDARDFRSADKARVLAEIRQASADRWDAAEHFATTREWDFLMTVDMGVDRVQHAFWQYHDPAHHAYPGPGNEFEHAIRDHYRFVDERVGRLLERVPDDARVVVVSDHGAKRMDGALALNDWLRREGDLVLKREPRGPQPFRAADVDWSRTRAWAYGGYHARVFVNVKGREPEGVVDPAEYDAYRADLARRLAALSGPDGRPIPGTRVATPEEEYGTRDVDFRAAPDLHVYVGDLAWRVTQRVGNASLWSRESEVGVDGATHDRWGVLAVHDPRHPAERRLPDARLADVAPTLLRLLGVPPPDGLDGAAVPGLPYPPPAFPKPATWRRDVTVGGAGAPAPRPLDAHARLAPPGGRRS